MSLSGSDEQDLPRSAMTETGSPELDWYANRVCRSDIHRIMRGLNRSFAYAVIFLWKYLQGKE